MILWKVCRIFICMTPKIYKITNDVNSKIYVGQTHKTIEERFNRHCEEGRWKNTKKMPIVLAIKKYGKHHFSIHILEELSEKSTQSVVDKKEVEWGLKLDCFSPNGYNLKLGGARGLLSEETKEKIRLSNIGKIVSDETRKKLSESHKGYRASSKTKKKMSEYWRGKKPHENTRIGASIKNSKTYNLIDPKGNVVVITNMAKFCKENGYDKSNMCELVRGKKKIYRGWKI